MYNEERFLQELEDSKSTSQYEWCHVLQKQVPLYQKLLNDVLFHNKTFSISYYETTDHLLLVFFVETNHCMSSYPYYLFEYYFTQRKLFSQECISKAYYCTHFFIGA